MLHWTVQSCSLARPCLYSKPFTKVAHTHCPPVAYLSRIISLSRRKGGACTGENEVASDRCIFLKSSTWPSKRWVILHFLKSFVDWVDWAEAFHYYTKLSQQSQRLLNENLPELLLLIFRLIQITLYKYRDSRRHKPQKRALYDPAPIHRPPPVLINEQGNLQKYEEKILKWLHH